MVNNTNILLGGGCFKVDMNNSKYIPNTCIDSDSYAEKKFILMKGKKVHLCFLHGTHCRHSDWWLYTSRGCEGMLQES